MFKRTLGQHAVAATLALTVALAAGLGAWYGLALRTGPAPDAATGVYIHNLGNTLRDQTRNLSRLSQALRTGDRLVVLGSSELTSTDLRFVPYRFLADELRMPVMAYGHSGFQSLGMQLVLAALADDLSPLSRVVIMVSPGWFDGDGGLGADEFREHANPLLPRLVRQPEGREQLARWLRDKGDARVAWSMAAEQAYVFRQRLVDLWMPAHAAPAPGTEAEGPAAAARVVDWDALAREAQDAEQARMTRNRYAVRDDFFDKYLQTVPAGGKTAFLPRPLTGKDELRELEALMRLLRNHGANALFVMQPLHPLVFKDLDRFAPIQRQVDALCARYAMACMNMYDGPYEIGTLRDVQHLGELGWLRVNQRIAEVFRP